jgi:hypothetical protein
VNKIKLKAYPCKEWEAVLKPRCELGSGRRRVDIDKLISHPMSRKANLKDFEIVAIVLYTGPMVIEDVVFFAMFSLFLQHFCDMLMIEILSSQSMKLFFEDVP